MNLGLSEKTVVITGGGSNIGYATVLAFAQEKANIVVAEIDEEQGTKVAKLANSAGGRAIFVRTDVSKLDQVEKMMKQALYEYKTIDILINNAGWDQTPLAFVDTPLDVWDKSIDINFRGVLNTCKTALPAMIKQGSGSIVNISSETGRIGEPKMVLYSGTKGGVISLSKALAKEVGKHNIRVNVICPGMTIPTSSDEIGKTSVFGKGAFEFFKPEQLTKMSSTIPLRKLAKPVDTANAILFLASSAVAGHITGQTLSVDGGYTMM